MKHTSKDVLAGFGLVVQAAGFEVLCILNN